MLKEFDLGPEAVAYIRSELTRGYTLAKYLLSLPLEQARVVTYLPTLISDEAARKFAVGGVTDSAQTLLLKAISFESVYLNQQARGYAVFEGYQPSETILAATKRKYFFYGLEEMYYFAASSDPGSEQLEAAARNGRTYPYIGVLTSLPDNMSDIQSGNGVTTDMLEEIAARTQHIIVGAYDDEGYLIWTRK